MSAKKRTYEFTDAEADQLYSYAKAREYDGWYSGNRDHFEQRHKGIMAEFLRHSLPPTAGGES